MNTLVLLALAVVAVSAVNVKLDVDASWTAWKVKYGKKYLSAVSSSLRQPNVKGGGHSSPGHLPEEPCLHPAAQRQGSVL